MRFGSVLTLLFAVVMGGIAAFLARNWLLSRDHSGPVAHATIVVAAAPLAFGTVLTSDNTKQIPWAAGHLPVGGFATKKDLFKRGRRISLSSIQTDEPILSSKITGPGQRASLSTLLDPHKRAITIRVNDTSGVAGFVLPGDRVDVVLIHNDRGRRGAGEASDLLLQDVKVIAVDQIASDKKDKPVVAKAVTLEVTPHQAQRIALATNVGRLSLILRKAGDSHIVESKSVTRSDLLQGQNQEEAQVKPISPSPGASPLADPDTTVTIVRDQKDQDYQVPKEQEKGWPLSDDQQNRVLVR